jgi:hypothetical protein
MLAYRNYIDLETTVLNLILPSQFVGKKVEVIVLENNAQERIINEDDKQDIFSKMMARTYDIELLNPSDTFRREDMYD